jgi:dTDP-4-amino-4,6-dideoxygalactose transaminase
MKLSFGTIGIAPKARQLINEALDTGWVSSGRLVRQFEDAFARLVGAKHAVAVSSGTDADALALATLYDFGAHRGDEVIIPALSFVATGNAVLQAGFTPKFVDIRRSTLNIDPDLIEQAITDRTAAIMPVHLMGKPAEMDAILAISARHSLPVIGDAAQAHGALYKGQDVGSLGDMTAYSLYVAHLVTAVEGGMIATDREDYAEILRSLRSHGRACKCKVCITNTGGEMCPKRFGGGTDNRFHFERIGFSCKMNELEAAVGLGSLENFEKILAKRRENLLAMIEGMRAFQPLLMTLSEEPHERIGPHALPIWVDPGAPFTRDELVLHLESHGIDSRDLFSSMPTQCPGFAFLGGKPGEFPEAEYMGNCGLHVGVHQDLGSEHVDYLLKTLDRFLAAKCRR